MYDIGRTYYTRSINYDKIKQNCEYCFY